MRIVISAGPMFGHVNTMLPVARAAQAAGHEVVVATGPELQQHVQQYGLNTWEVGPAIPRPSGPDAAWIPFFVESAALRAHDLVPRARDWSPDVVIHEETELAGAVAAQAADARHVVHGLGLMPPIRMWDGLGGAIGQLFAQWEVSRSAEVVRDCDYLDVCPPPLQPEGERIWARTHPVRPGFGEAASDEVLPAAIDDLPYEHTAHLTLGTVYHEASGVLAEAIDGLRGLPLNLVVTSGPGTDPLVFGSQPPHVLIVPYVSHALLLPRCQLVVSQGGAGILFGSLAHGIAQLVLPQGADQDMNAEAAQRSGAALALSRDEFSAERVAASARRLIDEPAFAERARSVQAEIAAMPNAAEALSRLLD